MFDFFKRREARASREPGPDGDAGRGDLRDLMRSLLRDLEFGAESGQGIDAQWCRELHDRYARCLGWEDGELWEG